MATMQNRSITKHLLVDLFHFMHFYRNRRISTSQMIIAKMSWLSILLYHFLLVDIALAAAIAGDKMDVKESTVSSSTVAKTTATTSSISTPSTTELPVKAAEHEEVPMKPEVNAKEGEVLEKPLPKKRGVLEELYRGHPENFDENGFDVNDEPTPEELFSASRSEPEERTYFRYNDRADSGVFDEGGEFENEGRRKRTAMLDGLYNRPQEYSNPEIELSPEEVMALLNILEERRLYNSPVQSPWSDYDNTVDSIEADMRDEDVYRERPVNPYEDAYDSNFESLGKYPTGVKRYMITRRRRNDFLGNPKLKVPIFRRAIL